MREATALRSRILSAVGACVLVAALAPVSCASSIDDPKAELESWCSYGRAEVVCFEPGSTHFNFGLQPPDASVMVPDPIFDANQCQVADQVSDGCCNPAMTGPKLVDGQCCYGFCTGACCGRPLLVDGAPRVAAVVERGDWSESLLLGSELDGLGAELRGEIAAQWQADAQLEHASIASFARFTLDLLAFAAPPDLVEAAQRAMGDEIAHARACFALASAYAGAPRGPGALAMQGVTASSSLADAAVAAVREGCVGETIAALTASMQAGATKLSHVQQVLERIARDEADHAELAWRFVRWAIEQGGEAVRVAVAATFRELCAASASDVRTQATPREAMLRAHGRISHVDAHSIHSIALRDVIEPCARALLRAVAPESSIQQGPISVQASVKARPAAGSYAS